MWTIASIAKGLERRYKLRNPKPSHFKVKQHTGLGYRLIGAKDEKWYVHHKEFPAFLDGPYPTREEANYAVKLIVRVLKLQNPKLSDRQRIQMAEELQRDAIAGVLGPRVQGLIRSEVTPQQNPTVAQVSKASALQDTMKRCPFCAEMIKAAAIVCRYCGRDLPAGPRYPIQVDAALSMSMYRQSG